MHRYTHNYDACIDIQDKSMALYMYVHIIIINLHLFVCVNIHYLYHESVKLERLKEQNILHNMKHLLVI